MAFLVGLSRVPGYLPARVGTGSTGFPRAPGLTGLPGNMNIDLRDRPRREAAGSQGISRQTRSSGKPESPVPTRESRVYFTRGPSF